MGVNLSLMVGEGGGGGGCSIFKAIFKPHT